MEPTINIKELVIIKEQKEYEVKDIVTYRDNNNFVTHRIVNKVGKTVITRGDNNTVNDEPININEIEGKVCYHSLILGELFLYWIKPILLLIISVLIINLFKLFFTKRGQLDEQKN